MRIEFKTLRIEQLDRDLALFRDAAKVARPARGWLRAVREALGISAREMGSRMGTGHQLPSQLEKSEADDAITLRSLRNAANALDCDLVYALVPRAGSVQQLIDRLDSQSRIRAIEAEAQRLARPRSGVGRDETPRRRRQQYTADSRGGSRHIELIPKP